MHLWPPNWQKENPSLAAHKVDLENTGLLGKPGSPGWLFTREARLTTGGWLSAIQLLFTLVCGLSVCKHVGLYIRMLQLLKVLGSYMI